MAVSLDGQTLQCSQILLLKHIRRRQKVDLPPIDSVFEHSTFALPPRRVGDVMPDSLSCEFSHGGCGFSFLATQKNTYGTKTLKYPRVSHVTTTALRRWVVPSSHLPVAP